MEKAAISTSFRISDRQTRTISYEHFTNGCIISEAFDFGPATNARRDLLRNRALIGPVKDICNARLKQLPSCCRPIFLVSEPKAPRHGMIFERSRSLR